MRLKHIKPQNILLFLAAYLPFESFLLKYIPDSIYVFVRYIPELLIYSLVLWIGILVWQKKLQYRSTPLIIPFFLLLLVAFASMIVNHTPLEVGVLGIRQIIRFILVYFIIVLLSPGRDFIKKLCVILFSVAFFEGMLGITQSIIGAPLDALLIPSAAKYAGSMQLTQGVQQFWESGQRVTGTLGRYDQLGIFLSMVLLIITALLYENSKFEYRNSKQIQKFRNLKILKRISCFGFRASDFFLSYKKYLIVLALTFFPAFLLSYSRAAWFGLALGLFVIGFIIKKDKRIAIAATSLICAGLLYIGYSSFTGSYLIDVPRQTLAQRFFEAFSLERWKGEYEGLGRLYWATKTPTVVVASSPLLGVGPGSYGGGAATALHYTTKYDELGLPFGIYGTDGYIDNNWFSLWGELGTLGLIIFAFMIIYIFLEARTLHKTSKDPFVRAVALAGMGIIVAVSFQALLATYFEVRTVGYYLWLLAGIVANEVVKLKTLSPKL